MTQDLAALDGLDRDTMSEAELRAGLRMVLNLVETLLAEALTSQATPQQLRDEINRLKGEQAKPTFRSKGPPPGPTNYSSEQERREPKSWQKSRKLDLITIDRVERRQVDPVTLPDDAIYKGIETVTVQDLILRTDNVQFELELWYSPAQQRRYRAPLPPGYEGEFGPGVKTLALQQTYGANVSQRKLLELFGQAGLQMSGGWLAGFPERRPK